MLYEKLNERKKELGLTTEQLSQLSGVPVGTLNKILSGETRSPRYDTLREIERVLYGGESGTQYEADADCVKEEAAVYFTKKQGEYTLEDYRRLPDDVRAELIDGELIFLEAPSFTHQEMITELLVEIKMFIRSHKGTCRVLPSPLDVQLDCDDRTMVQPDVVIVCDRDKIIDRCIYGAPDLVIEVLSKSTRKKDTVIKLNKYMNAGVREYWMIDPAYKKVIVYDFERDNYPAIYGFDAKVPVGIWNGDLEIDFAEVYEYVRFLYER